jgi:multidrug efflux pump subunit AcrB
MGPYLACRRIARRKGRFQRFIDRSFLFVANLDELGALAVMQDGSSELRLADIATLKPGTMPGLIERDNGQRVISLTANLHGITLGEAATKLAAAVRRAGMPPRGVTASFRGELQRPLAELPQLFIQR